MGKNKQSEVMAGALTSTRPCSSERCPFCGFGPDSVFYVMSNDVRKFFCQCSVCGACGPEALTKLLAVPLWNMRRLSGGKNDAKN